jgi:propanediol dehydratase small subunit
MDSKWIALLVIALPLVGGGITYAWTADVSSRVCEQGLADVQADLVMCIDDRDVNEARLAEVLSQWADLKIENNNLRGQLQLAHDAYRKANEE